LVIGGDVHTCWEKFANYFEVEARIAPMTRERYVLAADDVRERVDENTIAVGALLGTTFTGQMDDLEGIDELLGEIEAERGWRIPIHVDAASGGFITPFHEPKLKWDFRLDHVRSINVSNHKFGLIYPGMGSVVFRERDDVPDELVFHINYLGGDMPNYSLNFSRPASTVVLQYYNFLRLGWDGYKRVVERIMETAEHLAARILESGLFVRVGDSGHFPVIALRATDPERLDVYKVSEKLRGRGWIVPAYTLPPNAQEIAVLRIVVKENFSYDMAEMLVSDLNSACEGLLGGRGAHQSGGHDRPIC
jgi:glutamate decarboxylase